MNISIITINYNDAPGLEATLDSIRSQTVKPVEVIVVDGGSTDGSREVILRNEDLLTRWVSEPDGGIYPAMNKGIRQAEGEYLLFLNSRDTLCDPDVIADLSRYEAETSFLYGKVSCRDRRREEEINVTDVGLTLWHFFKGTLPHQATLIRRTLFERYGLYDESYRIVSDWKFFLVAIGLHGESAAFCDRYISVFDTAGFSNTHPELVWRERSEVLRREIPPSIMPVLDLVDRNRRVIGVCESLRRLKRSLSHVVKPIRP